MRIISLETTMYYNFHTKKILLKRTSCIVDVGQRETPTIHDDGKPQEHDQWGLRLHCSSPVRHQ